MGTVLIADDAPATRALLRVALTFAGYRVLEAADGDLAWEIVRTHPIAALVTDLALSGRNGRSLLASVRREDRLRDLPVVVVSADASAERTAAAGGADRVVLKPFGIGAISSAVTEAIGARQPLEISA